MNHPLFDILVKEIRTDIAQMTEAGHDEAALLAELAAAEASGSLNDLAALQADLWGRPSPPGFAYDEPSDLESISRHFPDPESHARFAGGADDLADRLLAGWRGRCVGCQLGKPLEGAAPDEVKEVLAAVGSWPLTDYMRSVSDERQRRLAAGSGAFRSHYRKELTRGHFDAVAPDDDIHYALTSQMVLEQHGPAFTADQAVARLIELTPPSCVFASGRSMLRTALFGIPVSHTAVFGNPCRQSLGGQIRCDPWGWGAPANPALAARMAYTDAAASQRRNGIYSAVFFAVLLADVLAHGDVPRAVNTAAGYVPPKSRFAEMVAFVRGRCAAGKDWEQVNAAIYERYDRGLRRPDTVRMNHCLPNAAIVLMGLLAGQGDFTPTVGVTVMAGMDTDCNGATAGSIMGCALGTAGIPPFWTDPFNDTIHTQLKGLATVRISEVAERMSAAAWKNVRRATT